MSQLSQPTVLVVEDEAELRQIIAESLEAKGFAVAQALDAADATSRLEGFAYQAAEKGVPTDLMVVLHCRPEAGCAETISGVGTCLVICRRSNACRRITRCGSCGR